MRRPPLNSVITNQGLPAFQNRAYYQCVCVCMCVTPSLSQPTPPVRSDSQSLHLSSSPHLISPPPSPSGLICSSFPSFVSTMPFFFFSPFYFFQFMLYYSFHLCLRCFVWRYVCALPTHPWVSSGWSLTWLHSICPLVVSVVVSTDLLSSLSIYLFCSFLTHTLPHTCRHADINTSGCELVPCSRLSLFPLMPPNIRVCCQRWASGLKARGSSFFSEHAKDSDRLVLVCRDQRFVTVNILGGIKIKPGKLSCWSQIWGFLSAPSLC